MSERVVLSKGWIVDGPGGARVEKAERPSQQIADDPFSYTGAGAESGLQRPLYDMDQLASQWTEANSLHGRCVRQKASDVLGRGIFLRGRDVGDKEPAAEEQDRWREFVRMVEEDPRAEGALKEQLTWAHEDFEGVGWAVLEVGRRRDGMLDGLWYVPGHTIRAHTDGRRFAMQRGGKTVWFKRFGIEGTVDRKDGGFSPDRTVNEDWTGNELLVIRNHTPRSSFYGAPDHIPAMAAMAGWKAQAIFNLRFFDNLAVPSYVVVVEGADITPELENMILEHFQRIKGEPSATLVIPVPGALGDDAAAPKVRFERLTVDVKDASHRMYKQDNALEICIAHGMPPYRVGWPLMGSLGGATAQEMTRIYNDAMVQPRQETWEQRLDRSLLGSKGLSISDWGLKCAELDVRNEKLDLELARMRYELGMAHPNDLIRFFGGEARGDPAGDEYIPMPLAPGAQAGFGGPPGAQGFAQPFDVIEGGLVAKRWSDEVRELAALRERIAKLMEPSAVAA